jgi:hypothetical protein
MFHSPLARAGIRVAQRNVRFRAKYPGSVSGREFPSGWPRSYTLLETLIPSLYLAAAAHLLGYSLA